MAVVPFGNTGIGIHRLAARRIGFQRYDKPIGGEVTESVREPQERTEYALVNAEW